MVRLCLTIRTRDGDTISYHIHYLEDRSPVQVSVTTEKSSALTENDLASEAKETSELQSDDSSTYTTYSASSQESIHISIE